MNCLWHELSAAHDLRFAHELPAALDHIIIRGLGLGEVGDRNAVKVFVGHVVKILPHFQGAAFRGAGARHACLPLPFDSIVSILTAFFG